MFQFVDTAASSWTETEKNAVATSLVEALSLLNIAGNLMLQDQDSIVSTAFNRYFSVTARADVKNMVAAVMQQLRGTRSSDWTANCAFDGTQLPLQIYLYFGPPGSRAHDHCEEERFEPGPDVVAFMDAGMYNNKPVEQYQVMVVCKSLLYGVQHLDKGSLTYRNLWQIPCSNIGSFATEYGEVKRYKGLGGMNFAGMDLLHEILHWYAFTGALPDDRVNLSDPDFVTTKGETQQAYRPWGAQELRRAKPDEAQFAVDNHVWYMAELFWAQRCLPSG